MREKLIAALTPFAEQAGPCWPGGHPNVTDDTVTLNAVATVGDFRRAAEVLAQLHAMEVEFREWLNANPLIGNSDEPLARAAFMAGRLSTPKVEP